MVLLTKKYFEIIVALLTCVKGTDDDLEDVLGHVEGDLVLLLIAEETLEELALSGQDKFVCCRRGRFTPFIYLLVQ
jgi:hypothetical protein